MAKVYVLTSGKGGVGKTTVTANLGCSLAKEGNRVCLIDADVGLKNLDVVLGLENRIIYTILDVVNGNISAKDALVRHKNLKNLFLLPASQIATKEMITPEDMISIVEALKDDFDYVLIDSPAGIERGFRNAIAPADFAIIVTTPELPAISDADRVIGLLENNGFDDKDIVLILNKFKVNMAKKGEMLSEMDVQRALAIDLIGIIPESDEVIISTNRGMPLVLENSNGLSNNFENIVKRLKGEEIPLELDLPSSANFISKIFSFFKKR
ncbi:septum site-determining protein MinD [Thermosipho melanesiensis]|uniref:Septum site-determining protein MinD n=2 Tax=Thermosipho melanesiensis TaxID=46541 RepID=A6LN94_THEM4|nr:septum site-determining protein MinD [Thermosipho melanesiensis]ABR31395.1 septum site-determining protein MinD [Thermosipho melanesiensis BI429]APT74455.1 septum site-determining protein MinD [Thermosipho melanesiensis]OOC36802.1 septum site-determining protein MinD [Thermosipho melanesiensis]OOC37339.1 septum site-determining protein MinD [Thermosipho melanesiensis]OOC38091.1 septum site-determining protein MinD [Thermosipho melanesiensis]